MRGKRKPIAPRQMEFNDAPMAREDAMKFFQLLKKTLAS